MEQNEYLHNLHHLVADLATVLPFPPFVLSKNGSPMPITGANRGPCEGCNHLHTGGSQKNYCSGLRETFAEVYKGKTHVDQCAKKQWVVAVPAELPGDVVGVVGAAGAPLNSLNKLVSFLQRVINQWKSDILVRELSLERTWMKKSLQLLNELTLSSLSGNDFNESLRNLLAQTVQTLNSQSGAITLINPQAGTFNVMVTHHLSSKDVQSFFVSQKNRMLTELKGGPLVVRDPMFMQHKTLVAPMLKQQAMIGILQVTDKEGGAEYTAEDKRLIMMMAQQLAVYVTGYSQKRDREELLLHTLGAISGAIDAKDPYTSGHTERVTLMALALANRLKRKDISHRDLRLAGLLRDIGYLTIPESILKKTEPLTPEEQAEIQRHPVTAASLLAPVLRVEGVVEAVRHHHERWDGKGYPSNLRGEEIPVMARILAICDAYDALLSPRPYRDGLPQEKAIAEIKNNLGMQFDPGIGQAFLRMMEEEPNLREAVDSLLPAPESLPAIHGGEKPQDEGDLEEMPILPQVALRLMEMAHEDPPPTSHQLIALLKVDPVLSSKLLKFANSFQEGFAGRVTSLEQAVRILGHEKIAHLAVGFTLYDSLNEQPIPPIWEQLSDHSLLVGVAARLIADKMMLPDLADEAFMAGLMHDIGKIVLIRRHQDAYLSLLESSPSLQQERTAIGTDHVETGHKAARSWGLPERLVEAISTHHAPERCQSELSKIVCGANVLAHHMEQNRPVSDDVQSQLTDMLGLMARDVKSLLKHMQSDLAQAKASLGSGMAHDHSVTTD